MYSTGADSLAGDKLGAFNLSMKASFPAAACYDMHDCSPIHVLKDINRLTATVKVMVKSYLA